MSIKWSEPEPYIVTTDEQGNMVSYPADPIKRGEFFGECAEENADLAWQRAFDNVLKDVDEEIIVIAWGMANRIWANPPSVGWSPDVDDPDLYNLSHYELF